MPEEDSLQSPGGKSGGRVEGDPWPVHRGLGIEGVCPPIFADVGERKGLRAGRVDVRETMGIRRISKMGIGEWGEEVEKL